MGQLLLKNENWLSQSEIARFEFLKAGLERTRGAASEFVAYLMEIRDSRLYRMQFTTFEDFCKRELGKSKSFIYQLIINNELREKLSTHVDTEQFSERTMSAINSVPASQQLDAALAVAQKARSEGRRPTYRDVQRLPQFIDRAARRVKRIIKEPVAEPALVEAADVKEGPQKCGPSNEQAPQLDYWADAMAKFTDTSLIAILDHLAELKKFSDERGIMAQKAIKARGELLSISSMIRQNMDILNQHHSN